ncbi:glutamate--cysteine ligase 2 [Pseudarthrobacter sp. MM222]|uniref:glutamate--cysteine ligase 2 n=1 Tax=Pseudarthrobacter sp. MM222 TaxID=3018929 RepID=UPI00221F684E|nr:glutamate--cysteine ligase [Pseudarthrobacter sp. MM222]CAI3800478.1 Glutamate--cysteine ligase [Pseudarthrobacter sp. MM222]
MNRPETRPDGRLQRTFGVEEEFLLVDPVTGRPAPVAELSLRHGASSPEPGAGPSLTPEVKQEQLEAVSPVCSTLQELAAAIREGRALADKAARTAGARAVALATSPIAATPTLLPEPRYLEMAARFGLTLKEQLTCGFHVHVSVISGEEGVAVLDRIRVWLPVLLALSANSPFWQGCDSGYASFRYQAWNRWPTAGPSERFGSEREYRRYVELLLATGVLLDEGMVYFDARLSRNHPTVEVRIADVCMDPDDATAIAAIVRALVERAAQDWRVGIPAPRLSAAQLRLAAWKASESGVDGTLLHPLLNLPCPAAEAVQALLTHVRPALASTGDEEQVTLELARILSCGTGSRRQRETMMNSQSLAAVVLDAVDRTRGTAQAPHRRSRRLQAT